MTKEEIEQYIELDNKIKNRIVQISHALQGVDSSSITAITPHVKQWFSNGAYDKEDFIENSNNYPTLYLGMECYDGWTCAFDKSLLMLSDEQINEIVDYDRKVKEEEIKHQKEVEKARQAQMKKETEEKEYEQYLKLKKKFEKEQTVNGIQRH